MSKAHHNHQSSLEGFIYPSHLRSLTLEESQNAQVLFDKLIEYNAERTIKDRCKPAVLISQMLRYIKSKDEFLEYFYMYIFTCIYPEQEHKSSFQHAFTHFQSFPLWDLKQKGEAIAAMDNFAEYVIDNFLMPLKASSVKTPQPTPISLSSSQNTPAGTSNRISRLRENYLIRDHHRCIVSHKFDRVEAKKRLEMNENSKDDDGRYLSDQNSDQFDYLEVAHIIPHSLMSFSDDKDSELSESKKTALHILKINALTLTQKYHRLFGEFELYFEEVSPDIKHQYRIDSTEQRPYLRDSLFPITRELYLSPGHTIDPLSRQLLAVHRAIAHILKLSGAGDYIDNILREMEEPCLKADGSTNIERFINMRLQGWVRWLTAF